MSFALVNPAFFLEMEHGIFDTLRYDYAHFEEIEMLRAVIRLSFLGGYMVNKEHA